ncbi:hypothetical protein Tco_0659584, partial [Tanacetum coccineum]
LELRLHLVSICSELVLELVPLAGLVWKS